MNRLWTELRRRNVFRFASVYGYAHVALAICAGMQGDDGGALRHISRAKQGNPHMRPDKLTAILTAQFDKEKGQREYALLERLWAGQAER